jgi:hypothetical protein
MNNYTVTVRLEVRAEDDSDAIDRVAARLRSEEKDGVSPIGDFVVEDGAPALLDKVFKP